MLNCWSCVYYQFNIPKISQLPPLLNISTNSNASRISQQLQIPQEYLNKYLKRYLKLEKYLKKISQACNKISQATLTNISRNISSRNISSLYTISRKYLKLENISRISQEYLNPCQKYLNPKYLKKKISQPET